jgi:hypothetical protein
MIREVCSCSAEIETDEDDALDIVLSWRRSHKHEFAPIASPSFFDKATSHDLAPGFQAPSYFEDE